MERLPTHNDFPEKDGELPRSSGEVPQCTDETLQTSGEPLENTCEFQHTNRMPAQINDKPQLGNVGASSSKRELPQSSSGFPLSPAMKRARQQPISPPSQQDLLETETSDTSIAIMHAYEQALRLKERNTLSVARVGPIGVSPQQPSVRSVTPDPPFPFELSPSDYDEFSHYDQDEHSSSDQDGLSSSDQDELSSSYQDELSSSNQDELSTYDDDDLFLFEYDD